MIQNEIKQHLDGCRVLVIEDEYFIADDLARALGQLGAEVVGPVPTREQALNILNSGQKINVAVLDINLGGDAVFPVADLLQERGVPFVFATGYDRSSLPEAYRHIPRWEKPFSPESLGRTLPSIMGQA